MKYPRYGTLEAYIKEFYPDFDDLSEERQFEIKDVEYYESVEMGYGKEWE